LFINIFNIDRVMAAGPFMAAPVFLPTSRTVSEDMTEENWFRGNAQQW
jgi:hypothetical protein